MWSQVLLVLGFIVLGGFFAAAELALVSLRPGQVSKLAASGRRGHQLARLVEDPNRFLSAVQIGVTLAGFFSASVGAVTLAQPVSRSLQSAGMLAGWADTVALVLVTIVIAYVSLVLGELAPKRLALQRPEPLARFSAPVIDALARSTRPVIWLLGRSSDLVVRLLGGDPTTNRETVTEEELRDLVAANSELSSDERRLIREVLDAGDRPLREVMVPRLDVSALQQTLTVADAVTATADLPYSRYPVVDGGLDDVVGFVHVRDLVTAVRLGDPRRPLSALARPLMRMPDTRRTLPALAEMRRARAHLAVVVDEYGGSAGIVTLEDLIEEVVGDITDEFDVRDGGHDGGHDGADDRDGDRDRDAGPRPLPAGPVNAQLRLDEFAEVSGVQLPEGPYDTAAGWLVTRLGRIPDVGDHAEGDAQDARRIRMTVATMRGRRVDRVLLEDVTPPPDTDAADDEDDDHHGRGSDEAAGTS